QGAEVPLALATVPRGEAPRVVHRVDHRLPELAAPAAIALGGLADAIAPAARLEASFCPCHLSQLLRTGDSGPAGIAGFFAPYPEVRKGGLTNTSILVGQELLDLLLLRFVDDLGATQLALALARLVAEQVALVRLLVLDVT